jgi:hypothetical protein
MSFSRSVIFLSKSSNSPLVFFKPTLSISNLTDVVISALSTSFFISAKDFSSTFTGLPKNHQLPH